MARITAIEAQKKNPERVNIYLDDEFAFGLTRFVAGWLQVGQTLTQEKIAQLQAEEAREATFRRALHFLSYRPRSLAEIRQNLSKHNVQQALIEETLERLQQQGLANDEQFARAWVENRNTFRPRSRRALRMELRQKGLEDELIQAVLDENLDDEALAYQASLRKARKLNGLEWPDFRRKLSEFLARRGFSFSVITPIVRKVWDEKQMDVERQTLEDEETA
jgi:regulatory protein